MAPHSSSHVSGLQGGMSVPAWTQIQSTAEKEDVIRAVPEACPFFIITSIGRPLRGRFDRSITAMIFPVKSTEVDTYNQEEKRIELAAKNPN